MYIDVLVIDHAIHIQGIREYHGLIIPYFLNFEHFFVIHI